jgi:O-6-methylguanine DNA methyltransferase
MVYLGRDSVRVGPLRIDCRAAGVAPAQLAPQLRAYLAGQPVRFKFRLAARAGTPFQRKVWRVLLKIPRGQTRSYAWVARQIGRPKAVRAVANACGANPVPILVPCHRVIASDGSLGGFGGGLALKKKLLALER